MRALLLVLLLLPQLAEGQVRRPRGGAPRTAGDGPLIAEPAGTLAHVYVSGNGILDTKANAWALGTTRRKAVAGVPIMPLRHGIGPFSSGGRLTLGAGADALDVADFETCVVFSPVAVGATSFFANGNGTTLGYTVGVDAAGACTANIGGTNLTTANAFRLGGLNVCCAGRSGTTGSVMMNGGALATATVTNSADTARIATLGTANSGTTPFTGYVYEFIFVGAAYSDTWARSVVARFNPRRTN